MDLCSPASQPTPNRDPRLASPLNTAANDNSPKPGSNTELYTPPRNRLDNSNRPENSNSQSTDVNSQLKPALLMSIEKPASDGRNNSSGPPGFEDTSSIPPTLVMPKQSISSPQKLPTPSILPLTESKALSNENVLASSRENLQAREYTALRKPAENEVGNTANGQDDIDYEINDELVDEINDELVDDELEPDEIEPPSSPLPDNFMNMDSTEPTLGEMLASAVYPRSPAR